MCPALWANANGFAAVIARFGVTPHAKAPALRPDEVQPVLGTQASRCPEIQIAARGHRSELVPQGDVRMATGNLDGFNPGLAS